MDELQILRTRVGEMAAEIERLTTESARFRAEIEESRKALNAEIILSDSRADHVKQLQSVIDEANAQEPVVYLNVDTELGYTFVDNGFVDDLMDGKHPLYTHPIPAQQSPAVAVPEPYAWANNDGETSTNEIQVEYWKVGGKSVFELYTYNSLVALIEEDLRAIRHGVKHNKPVLHIINKLISASGDFPAKTSASPRITEQDALEIIKSFEDFADEDESAYEESAWLTYMAWSGRALLDKLNGVQHETN